MKIINKNKIIKNDENIMLSEMEIMKKLDHPNILKIHEL